MTDVIGALGYNKIGNLVFRHSASTVEVEHLLFFSMFQQQNARLLTADFGLRNSQAQEFSRYAMLEWGGQLFKNLRSTVLAADCFMRFSIWRFSDQVTNCYWRIGDERLYETVVRDVSLYLLDFVGSIGTAEQLFRTLVHDEKPCPWVAANGAIRAAQIAKLGADIHETLENVQALLISKNTEISAGLSTGVNAGDFLDKVLHEAWRTVLH